MGVGLYRLAVVQLDGAPRDESDLLVKLAKRGVLIGNQPVYVVVKARAGLIEYVERMVVGSVLIEVEMVRRDVALPPEWVARVYLAGCAP